jgi:hypothetical protein
MKHRRYDPEPAWTFYPLDFVEDGKSLREMLSNLIFVEKGTVVVFDAFGVSARDTGWKVDDFVLE